ncbi:metalloproteinase inhibitor 2b [Betta splendens]|uniref:Metalloproteinase inhibitor 2 n=1 Tax=Betta splendens TaxID=158456 RepID=A0A6P7N8E5_BETSP|nr:metalloproteinase inhibitor 2b [Betta splendens]
MTWALNSCFLTLAVLLVWQMEELAEACSCVPAHPQQAFCNADVVIRAKVVGKEDIKVDNNIYGSLVTHFKYNVKQIKMFKGPSQNIDAIYTPSLSSVCGVTLKTNGQEYLITGRLNDDGKMHISLCNFIEHWEALTATQQKNLVQRYETGCDCKINRCTSIPCVIGGPAECLWTDWIVEKTARGNQAKHFSCIKRSDESCAWYRGAEPPKKDFLDIEDP